MCGRQMKPLFFCKVFRKHQPLHHTMQTTQWQVVLSAEVEGRINLFAIFDVGDSFVEITWRHWLDSRIFNGFDHNGINACARELHYSRGQNI